MKGTSSGWGTLKDKMSRKTSKTGDMLSPTRNVGGKTRRSKSNAGGSGEINSSLEDDSEFSDDYTGESKRDGSIDSDRKS